MLLGLLYAIAHCPVTTLPFILYTQQGRVSGVHEIDDPNVGFAGVFPVQTPGVLLECAFSGYWHRQYQRVQRRVIEALADKFASRNKNVWRVWWQRIQISNQRCSLLSGHSTMQNERLRFEPVECHFDGIQMFCSLG